MKHILLLIAVLAAFGFSAFAQQGMGVGNANPQEMLDVSGAIKIGTDLTNTTGAPSGGAGTVRFRAGTFEGWDGTAWTPLGGGSGTDSDWMVSGVNQYSGVSGNVGIGTTTPNYKLDVSGSARFNNGSFVNNGLAANPSISFSSDSNTGIYSPSADNLGFATGGSEGFRVDENGNVGMGPVNPDAKLDLVGSFRYTDGNQGVNKVLRSDGSGFATWVDPTTLISNDGDWTISGNNQYSAVTGNVGIGETNPVFKLDVGHPGANQQLRIRGNWISNHANNARANFIDWNFGVGAGRAGSAGDATVMWSFNGAGRGILFASTSNGLSQHFGQMQHNMYIQGSDGNVGIGTTSPTAKLEVAGQVKITGGAPGANKVLTSDATGLATWVDPATLVENAGFTTTSGVTSNAPGTYASDDFVFGSAQLDDDDTTPDDDARFFFDKSKAAFRAGFVPADQWDAANVGNYSTAFGQEPVASGSSSVALGAFTVASGNSSFAAGIGSDASGDNSVALGYEANASGLGSTSTGFDSDASGIFSFAGGDQTEASGPVSVSMGTETVASGPISTAFGSSTTASGPYSTTFGSGSSAISDYSLASGLNTIASGIASLSAGTSSVASGSSSVAVGVSSTAKSYAETTVGMYNTDYTPISTGAFSATDRLFVVGNGVGPANPSNAVTVLKNGNTGLGTDNPAAKLDVAGTVAVNDNQIRLRGGSDANHYLSYIGGSFDGAKLTGFNNVILNTVSGGDALIVTGNRVGIGTTSPIAPLHVESQASASYGNFTFYAFQTNAGGGSCCAGLVNGVSIHASGRVMASEFDAFSDARIKNVIGVSNTQEDLQRLLGIEITNYRMKDKAKDVKPYKKVIAQQVETVYPEAVSTITEVIPNIYTVASIENGYVKLNADVEVGDKVKLIKENGSQMVTVIATDETGFRIDSELNEDVFVYGKEVDDFRAVDYEAISMLNVSATQELFKMILNLQDENADLKASVDSLSDLRAEIEKLKEWTQFEQQTTK